VGAVVVAWAGVAGFAGGGLGSALCGVNFEALGSCTGAVFDGAAVAVADDAGAVLAVSVADTTGATGAGGAVGAAVVT